MLLSIVAVVIPVLERMPGTDWSRDSPKSHFVCEIGLHLKGNLESGYDSLGVTFAQKIVKFHLARLRRVIRQWRNPPEHQYLGTRMMQMRLTH